MNLIYLICHIWLTMIIIYMVMVVQSLKIIKVIINYIEKLYNSFIESGVSPKYDEVKDKELLEWLKIKTHEEFIEYKEKKLKEIK